MQVDLSTAAPVIAVIKDSVLAIAAAVTATMAVRGFNAWRREVLGKAHFEVARGLARATYKLRDQIQSYRSPLLRSYELPAGYESSTPPNRQADYKAHVYVYDNRGRPLAEAIREFDAQALEAEALWGSDIAEKVEALRKCLLGLSTSVDAVLDDVLSGGDNIRGRREDLQGARAKQQLNVIALTSATVWR